MAFSHTTVTIAFVRAGGQCECTGRICRHPGRCLATFHLPERATPNHLAAGWVPHHRQAALAGEREGIANCEILCLECGGTALR